MALKLAQNQVCLSSKSVQAASRRHEQGRTKAGQLARHLRDSPARVVRNTARVRRDQEVTVALRSLPHPVGRWEEELGPDTMIGNSGSGGRD